MTDSTHVLKAPKDEAKCPYRNGTFLLTCDIPQNYPREPPEIRFVTFILHPNVSDMVICDDVYAHVHIAQISRSQNRER